jgi:flagellar basal-body rod protein FlgC
MRVNVLASNIANAETTRTPEGGPYKRRDVVQVGISESGGFGDALDRASMTKPMVAAVVEDQSEPRKVYQPGHPDADPSGYVSYPNINVVTTMTDLMSASRLYQANVTAIETVRRMVSDAQNISRS